MERPTAALAWSGLAAGLSIGFSLVGEGLLQSHLPDTEWRPLISKFGYSIGFLIAILGRQQLFTENTLTPVLQLLTHPDRATFSKVLRLWLVVLATNLLGTFVFAAVIGNTGLFDAPTREAFLDIAGHAVVGDPWKIGLEGIFSGWLIAMMVWLLPFAESGRIAMITLITYLVALSNFTHIVSGSTDAFYLLTTGHAAWGPTVAGFLLPTLLGNILGGVALVAVLNHAQVLAGKDKAKTNVR